MPYKNVEDKRRAQRRYYESHKEEVAKAQRRRRNVPDYVNIPPRIITPEQVSWLAGLYEGEGSRELRDRGNGSWSIALTITMTDKDVIEKVLEVTGVGAIDYQPSKADNRKDAWRWKVTRREQIVALVEGMWPYLHSRRRGQLLPLVVHCQERLSHRLPTYQGYVNLQIGES